MNIKYKLVKNTLPLVICGTMTLSLSGCNSHDKFSYHEKSNNDIKVSGEISYENLESIYLVSYEDKNDDIKWELVRIDDKERRIASDNYYEHGVYLVKSNSEFGAYIEPKYPNTDPIMVCNYGKVISYESFIPYIDDMLEKKDNYNYDEIMNCFEQAANEEQEKILTRK